MVPQTANPPPETELGRPLAPQTDSTPVVITREARRAPAPGEQRRPGSYRPLLLALAVIFAAATITYSVAWMYYTHQGTVELGIDTDPVPGGIQITSVYPNSPAQNAGLKAHDLITSINGRVLAPQAVCSDILQEIWVHSRPGDHVTLQIQRAGEAHPLLITGTFRARAGRGDTVPLSQRLAFPILIAYPILFLVVGLVVLFLRLEDRNAWLLALVLATFICASDLPDAFAIAPQPLHDFLYSYRTLFNSLLPPMFYFFFAVFPTRSPIDRKVPWLKWALLAVVCLVCLGGIRTGQGREMPFLGTLASKYFWGDIRRITGYGSVTLGVISLLLNIRSAPSKDDKRKLKVILFGTVVGITPALAIAMARDFYSYHVPFWIDFIQVIFLSLFPLSFAYAVVKHRVLEIPVLLKRSARYFAVERGFVFLILTLGVGATFWLAQVFSSHFSAGSKTAIPVGATFGVLLISAGTEVHRRVRTRLDRAFFRSSYDAQQILEELAAKILTVTSREKLAALLQQNIQEALHPESLYVYLDNGHGQFASYAGEPPPDARSLTPRAGAIAMLAEYSGPVDVDPDEVIGTQLEALRPECLVPIRGSSEGQLQGGLVLGPRLSEEPYSASDRRLLASVASQAGIAMRSINLAEKMAGSMEAERRAAQEMEIARQVQSRLLPQQAPVLKTLDCAGQCIQTRAVGGDYFDFLDFGSGRLGLVLADISGKGMSGALLMANLQANLRSQYALALEDISKLLRSVNQLFFKNSEAAHYATMFFALYDDETRRLQYVNCGHNPPVLLRAGGCVERLAATATVLGMFEDWDCTVAELQLAIGDVLVIYTDGISEASPDEEAEFGEERLIEVTQRHQQQSAEEILQAVVGEVQAFSHGVQADDMTLIVARGR